MKKRLSYLAVTVTILVLLFSLSTLPASASEVSSAVSVPRENTSEVAAVASTAYSGYCGAEGDGTNLTWSLDTTTGELKIEGSGKMQNFYSEYNRPWNNCRSKVKSVFVADGVTSIGYGAFSYFSWLRSIYISNTVSTIGESAFEGCTKLVEVINQSEMNIRAGDTKNGSIAEYAIEVHKEKSKIDKYGDYLFYSCDDKNYLFEYVGSGERIFLPENYNGESYEIYKYAFSTSLEVKGVKISNGVTAIGDYAFGGRKSSKTSTEIHSIDEIIIGDNIKVIGNSAFRACGYLTKVVIPDSVEIISDYAFYDCGWLSQPFKSVSIGIGVKGIGEYAFNIESLEELYISDLTSWCNIEFENYASNPMYYAENTYLNGEFLRNLDIPEGVKEIKATSFFNNDNLVSVRISNDVESIGIGAFNGCDNIRYLVIGDKVKTIEANAFLYCTGLVSISLGKGLEKLDWQSFGGSNRIAEIINHSDLDTATLISVFGQITSVGYGNAILEIHTGESKVKEKGGYLFYNYEGVNYLIGTTSLKIGESLISLNLPEDYFGEKYVINKNAFYGYYLHSIKIPECVTSIGENAFYTFSRNTENVYITNLAKWCEIDFGNSASNPLNGAKNIYLDGVRVTDIEIPDGVTSIGQYAFYGCCLKNITIPNSVTSIGDYAFENCEKMSYNSYDNAFYLGNDTNPYLILIKANDLSIKQCNINYNTKVIHSGAFVNCNELESILIPYGVTNIGAGALYGCTSLEYVEIPNSVICIGDAAFMGCASLTNIEIPDSVTTIGIWAFSSSGLETITIGTGVKQIDYDAFLNCYDLRDVYVKDVSSWLNISFEGEFSRPNTLPYSKLHFLDENGEEMTAIVIPEGITEIKDYAFAGCEGMVSIELPSSITSIGHEAFSRCNNLYKLTNKSDLIIDFVSNEYSLRLYVIVDKNGNKEYRYETDIETDDNMLWSYWLNGDEKQYVLIAYLGDKRTVTLPTDIDGKSYAISNMRGVVNVIIPQGIKTINESAFSGCTTLKSISIPDSVTSIGSRAFYGCTLLTSIEIPNSVTEIGSNAFYGCTGLTSINIPKSVTTIGEGAFASCNSLVEIKVDEFNSNYKDIDGNLYAKDGKELIQYAIGKINTDFIIPNGVEFIGLRAFCGCDSLVSITVPDSVTSIGYGTFDDCKLLVFEIYENVKYLGNEENPYFALISTSSNALTAYSIHERTTVIADSAFECHDLLQSITIPDGVTNIGKRAFYSCDSLESVVIGNSITRIEESTFGFCSLLKNVIIGNSVVTIGDRAFSYCSSLKDITIPNGVTSIGICAFSSCDSLKSITLPNSIIKINEGAFYYCTSLETVYYHGTRQEWNQISIDNWNGNNEYLINAEKIYLCSNHSYDEWEVIDNANCTNDGNEKRTCTVCRYEESRKILPLGHTWNDGVVTKEPTEEERGVMTFTCTVCASTKTADLPKLSNVTGDIDGSEEITSADAVYLLMNTFFPEDYPISDAQKSSSDFDGDGEVNSGDAVYLLMYTFFPEDYPLQNTQPAIVTPTAALAPAKASTSKKDEEI